MSLVKLQPGEISPDSPIPFAIYTADGMLLLQEGQIATMGSLFNRLHDLGFRKGSGKERGAFRRQASSSQEGNTEILIGSTQTPGAASSASTPEKEGESIALPNLTRQVEFFRLTRAGDTEAIQVELVGIVHEKAIIVKSASPTENILLEPHHDYDAKLFIGCHLSSFSTRLTQDGVGPFGCFYLTYPENLAQSTIRKYRRVTTSFPARLQSGEYQRAATDVTVCNVSLTGAGVSSDVDFLTVGQNARLTMNLTINHRARPVAVYVAVQNRREKDGTFFYGLEFVRISDEVRHEIKDFVLERLSMI